MHFREKRLQQTAIGCCRHCTGRILVSSVWKWDSEEVTQKDMEVMPYPYTAGEGRDTLSTELFQAFL